MSKLNIKRQLGLLYISNFMFNISIAGAAWVLLLVSDGYSLVQVGFAETVFHIVSLIAEIPSGMTVTFASFPTIPSAIRSAS